MTKKGVKELVKAPSNQTTDEFSLNDVMMSKTKRISPVYIKKLDDYNISDMFGLVAHGPAEVVEITGMTREEANTAVEYAHQHLIASGKLHKSFERATDVANRRRNMERFTSGSNDFDNFLIGGFETQSSYELYGEYRSGKTQTCFTAAVMAQLPKEKGGLDGQVIYLDTEGTFRPERITQIVISRNLGDPEEFLNGIIYSRLWNYDQQMLAIREDIEYHIRKEQEEGHKPIRLVIVDSLIALFRGEMTELGQFSYRQKMISKMYHLLNRLSEIYNFSVIVTNQMVAGIGMFEKDHAAGGNIVGHKSTYRIYLRSQSKGIIARMEDSPMHARYEVILMLGEKGVTDPEKDS
jgi:DNA repair protein RadA